MGERKRERRNWIAKKTKIKEVSTNFCILVEQVNAESNTWYKIELNMTPYSNNFKYDDGMMG